MSAIVIDMSCIHHPPRGDDSTVSSWPTSPTRAGLNQKTCCRHLTLRTYLGVSFLLAFIFFIWTCGTLCVGAHT